jgi:hypothetical protein
MKNEATPQVLSMKNFAVLNPSVPIQLWAAFPSIQESSSLAVNRCEVMLSSIKQLTTNKTAPKQNLTISAFGISSGFAFVESPRMSLKNCMVLVKKFCGVFSLFLFFADLGVFLGVLFSAIIILGKSFAKLMKKNVKGKYLMFFFLNLYSNRLKQYLMILLFHL